LETVAVVHILLTVDVKWRKCDYEMYVFAWPKHHIQQIYR